MAEKLPLNCSDCGMVLSKVNYTIWGTKRFDQESLSYREDEALGETDMEFTCPNCSAKLDLEGIIF